METEFFKNNFWGEKNAGFDVLYHNMKHGQIATKELAEFVRERAAVEETYSKSMSKLAKMASNGSPLGTFAPMWDLFRMSSDKVALCHLELMRKMNELIRDLSKYGEEQVKVHRKTKEEVIGTLEAVQALQVQNGHLQKAREGYHAKCMELERLRKEGAPQKELEKAELKSKKAFDSFAATVEKFNRTGGDFEKKMSDSAQKFQGIEDEHLQKMKQLIKSYTHSIEDTHVQVGQVHEEFKQNVENISSGTLIQKFTEQKGTGKERPGPVVVEEFQSTQVSENKKTRAKAFRIRGLGKRDKEPDFTDSALTETPNSPLEVDDEGFMIRADVGQNGCTDDKENNFYSSDSDYDDEEPKKFHIQIRPVCSRSNPAANELELKASVGSLILPPNPGATTKRHISRNISTAGRSEEESDSAPQRECETEALGRFTSSPNHSRLSSTASGSDSLFGPPLDSAFKSHSFTGREQLQTSEYAAFSSASSSPENVEDSGLDSPFHQPLGVSPEPTGWAAWPSSSQPSQRPVDTSLGLSPVPQEWSSSQRSPLDPPLKESSASSFAFSSFSSRAESSAWSCKHIPQEDPFLAAFEHQPTRQDAWVAPPPPRPTHEDPLAPPTNSTKALPPPNSSCNDRERKRECSVPPPDSPDDPFAITMIGSPTHQSTLAAHKTGSGLTWPSGSNSAPAVQSKKESTCWSSDHNPFSDVTHGGGRRSSRSRGEGQRRSGPPLTRLSGPQEDLCFSTDKDQDCLDISTLMGPQRRFSTELHVLAPPRPARSKRSSSRPTGSERVKTHSSRSLCSSPLPEPSPPPTSSSSSSSPSDWGGQTQAPSPARGFSRGPSPISLSAQELWPVAAAFTEYINAYFKGGENNRCLVKITGDLTMSFPAGISRIFAANPNPPVLSFRLLGISQVDHFLPNQKLLFSDPSQNDLNSRNFWFNMQALSVHLQREAELNPHASYHNLALLKYQVSSQDPARAPLLLSAECQRSGTVTRVALDYHYCPATAPATQLTGVQVLLPLDPTATDLQCQPPATWKTEEKRLLWKLPNLLPTNHSKGSGTLCASWQCLEEPRGPAPSLAVQFVGTGASLSGLDLELVGGRYRMSLLKKRFATGKYLAGCLL